jgi:glycosyltransferase involved in cell wall biosynthesis
MLASVVIPAHNESASIARTLTTLRRGTSPGELEVVVVCNGCTDDTAELVRRTDPAAAVVEIADAGKAGAVRVGNEVARTFPRVHLDADIEITGDSVRALVGSLGDGVHAAGPRREIPRRGCGRAVRAYYRIWERLPNVSTGLFGRGVVALTAEGQRRVSALPSVMSDDLAVSDAFAPHERRVVEEAVAVVRPPRTIGDLLRRRERVVTGNAQAERARLRRDSSVTRPADLVGVLRRRPTLAPQMVVFLGVTVVARVRGGLAVRRGDFTTWQRDESSRA